MGSQAVDQDELPQDFNRFARFIECEFGRAAQLGDLVDDKVNAFLAQEADRKTMARNDCVALPAARAEATKYQDLPTLIASQP